LKKTWFEEQISYLQLEPELRSIIVAPQHEPFELPKKEYKN